MTPRPSAKPFADNDDYLAAVKDWAFAVYVRRVLERRIEYMGDLDDFDAGAYLPSGTTPEKMFLMIERRLQASRAAGFVPPLVELAESAGLDRFEYQLLYVSLLGSLGAAFLPAPVRRRRDRPPRSFEIDRSFTIGICLTLLCDGLKERRIARRYFHRDQRIFAKGILALEDSEYTTEERFLQVDVLVPRRIFNAILGETGLDNVILSYAKLVDPAVDLENVVLSAENRRRAEAIVEASRDEGGHQAGWRNDLQVKFGHAITVLLIGPAGTGKNLLAHAVAKRLGKRLLHINYSKLISESRHMQGESAMEAVLREAWLQDAVPFFDECQDLFERDAGGNDFLTSIEYQKGLILFATNEWVKLDKAFERRMLYRLEIATPDAPMRETLWQMHMPKPELLAEDIDVRDLGLTYELNGGNIKNAVIQAVQEAVARDPIRPLISQSDLREAAEGQMRAKIDLADVIVPTIGLDQVILPLALRKQVDEIVSVSRSAGGLFTQWGFGSTISRGHGVTVLFRGEPGTGKTLTAEAIAKSLGRTLYKINTAAIMSMWVGQTEKNIRELFRSARNVPAVLLFDEADGLFGQRATQIRNSTDRFANNETNVLLQEIEEFSGLAILTSNLSTAIDPAFERRMSYRIDFPLPERHARAQIWRTLIPAQCPIDEAVDFDALGERFPMSGGYIKNAVLRAARIAYARGDAKLTWEALLQAGTEEYASLANTPTSFGFVPPSNF